MSGRAPMGSKSTPQKDGVRKDLPTRSSKDPTSDGRKLSQLAKGGSVRDSRTSTPSRITNSSGSCATNGGGSGIIRKPGTEDAAPGADTSSHGPYHDGGSRNEAKPGPRLDGQEHKKMNSAREEAKAYSKQLDGVLTVTSNCRDNFSQNNPTPNSEHLSHDSVSQRESVYLEGPKKQAEQTTSHEASKLDNSSTLGTGDSKVLRTNFVLPLNAQRLPTYPAVKVLELMKQCGDSELLALEKFLKGLRVETSYLQDKDGKPRTKVLKIRGFGRMREPQLNDDGTHKVDKFKKLQWKANAENEPGTARSLKFLRNPGEMISVKDYFTDKHRYRLSNPDAWVLDCGSKKRSNWIPTELATIVRGQVLRGGMGRDLRARIIEEAVQGPGKAWETVIERKIPNIVKVLARGELKVGNFIAMSIPASALVLCQPLATPSIEHNNSPMLANDAAWNMENKKVQAPTGDTLPWTVLKLGKAKLRQGQGEIIQKALGLYGLNVEAPMHGPNFSGAASYAKDVVEVGDKFKKFKKDKISLVIVVLPSTDAANYEKIKLLGDSEHGIHTICLQSSELDDIAIGKLERKTDEHAPYYANIVLKFNLKAGGTNHVLGHPMPHLTSTEKILFIGIGISHPAQDDKTAQPKIAGVVANADTRCGQWPGSIRCQSVQDDMVVDLQKMVEERLNAFVKMNGDPSNIIVYRTGIPDDKYQKVLDEELPKIKKARNKVCKSESKPPITIIAASKGHQKRFFTTAGTKTDAVSPRLPEPGSMVCRGATMGPCYDFFLQAHNVPLARDKSGSTPQPKSAKPVHYAVIHNEDAANHEAGQLEQMTHNLCYLVGRTTKAHSLCAPAYYAGLICKRARCLLRQDKGKDGKKGPWKADVHKDLEKSMWYI